MRLRKTPGEGSREATERAAGKAGGTRTFPFWDQHVWAAVREQTLASHPRRAHANVSVIFSGQELHHTSYLQCLLACLTDGKVRDLQAVPRTRAPSTPWDSLLLSGRVAYSLLALHLSLLPFCILSAVLKPDNSPTCS